MSIITTFETQCRALSSTTSLDENASRFLVGTLSPSIKNNYVYLFEYKDDSNSLAKISMKFPFGEIWHLGTSIKHPNLMSAVTGQNGKNKVSLFRLPQDSIESPIEDDYGLLDAPVEKLFDITTDDSKPIPQSHWHPDEGDRVLICDGVNLDVWDVEKQQNCRNFSFAESLQKLNSIQESQTESANVTDLRWSSLFNCSVIAAAINSKIYGFDTRVSHSSPSSVCWSIEDDKCIKIRSIDLNPNSQYFIASGGDDCCAKFWDLRQTQEPALNIRSHTHWIWSIRYNPFHDQLVLTAGSDARSVLMRAQSISSEPISNIQDEDEGREDRSGEDLSNGSNQSGDGNEPDDMQGDKSESKFDDGVVEIYEEHDDSIYSAEWGSDPWIFASLGFESRLIINKVPKAEKFNILFR